MTPEQEEALTLVIRDRRLAHEILFAHRHTVATASFHHEIIDALHGPDPRVCIVSFRDSAKSTYAEEAIAIMGGLREFSHAMLVGASLDKACERLHAIRRMFERNADLRALFGDLVGHPWGDEDIELSSGIRIHAMGRGQAIRGTKAEDYRPDLILCDDIEDRASLATEDGREKVQNWFFDELLPSGDRRNLRVRILANDMHVECLANRLETEGSGWTVKRYPCMYKDPVTGEDRATWPASFPLLAIDDMRARMYAVGRGDEFEQNYLCRSTVPAQRLFKRDMIRIAPQIRTWQAVYAAYDPARTTNKSSADTGHARWSWVGNRLVVWEAWGRQLLPDEIIQAIYEDDGDPETGRFVKIGVDEVGLSEFLMQPLRQEGVKRGKALPVEPLKLRQGKAERIRALQPWFIAHEVILSKPLPDLESQLVNYPTGKVDILDCLACALIMRPGQPLYEDFTTANVADGLDFLPGPAFLALNASPALVTAALCQYQRGRLLVHRDWVREGEASALLADILREARLESANDPVLVAGPPHFDQYRNVGLAQAARRLPREIRRGASPLAGRADLRRLLAAVARGEPCLAVDPRARWTLNALAGGYTRALDRRGVLSDEPEDGPYRVLMEGLESLAGLLRLDGFTEGEESDKNFAQTIDGRRYISALPQRERR